eukprot:11195459-Heterocapsa_arctica.AAC.1
MAEIISGSGGGQQEPERGRGPAAAATPTGTPAPTTPQRAPAGGAGQRTPNPNPEGAGSPAQRPPADQRTFGPALEEKPAGKKRGADEEAGAFQFSQDAIRSGAAMDVEPHMAAAPVPGAMTQPEEQQGQPMELDGGDGSALTQEEQEQWD